MASGCDHAFHMAADMGGMGFIQSNHSVILYNNTMISYNFLEACRQAGVQRWVAFLLVCLVPGRAARPACSGGSPGRGRSALAMLGRLGGRGGGRRSSTPKHSPPDLTQPDPTHPNRRPQPVLRLVRLYLPRVQAARHAGAP